MNKKITETSYLSAIVVNFSSFVALLTSALCRSVEILNGKKRLWLQVGQD